MFQFTLPRGERQEPTTIKLKSAGFQFTLPRGERRERAEKPLDALEFQFTLPRGERHHGHHVRRAFAPVSIHVPAWGATFSKPRGTRVVDVSIHAPAWGATSPLHCQNGAFVFQFTLPHGERHGRNEDKIVILGFNSRSRMGSDTTMNRGLRPSKVSIHAPAWGATPTTPRAARAILVSIHAPAWGATNGATLSSLPSSFQFTLPHGERLGPL